MKLETIENAALVLLFVAACMLLWFRAQGVIQ